MICRAALFLLLGALPGTAGAQVGSSAPPAVALDFDGRILDWTSSCADDGCALFFLVGPRQHGDTAERSVYRYLAGASTPELLASETFSSESPLEPTLAPTAIVALPPASGGGIQASRVLLASPERLFEVTGGRVAVLLADQRMVPVALRELAPGGRSVLPLLSVGRLALWRLRSAPSRGAAPNLLARARLPVDAKRTATAIELRSPPVHRIEGPRLAFAVGPQEYGPQRWRVTLLESSAEAVASGEGSLVEREVFVRTPGPERPVGATFVRQGEQLYLVAHALRSDHVAILEKQKVRVYPLLAERVRAGSPPLLAELTVSRHWQELGSILRDVDDDGVLDLALFQREGFDGRKLQLDIYSGRQAQGRLTGFEHASKQLFRDAEHPEWLFGPDVDGDGRPDLVLADATVAVYPGKAADRKGRVVADQPAWQAQVGAIGQGPSLSEDSAESYPRSFAERPSRRLWSLDVDGRAPAEIMIIRSGEKADRVWVFSPRW